VSIKNKLVTAVTTAGLLAGLFGSAFVPSVRAAALTADDATQTLGGTPSASDASYQYWATTAYPVFTMTINADDNTAAATSDDGTYSVTVAGGTIRSCVLASIGGTVVVGSVVSGATSCSAALAFTALAASDAAEARWTVTLNKLTAGQTVTISVADDGSATVTTPKKLRGIVASTLNTISGTYSTYAIAGFVANNATGTLTSLWNGTPSIGIIPENGYDAAPGTYGLATATVTGPYSVALTDAANCAAVAAASYDTTSQVVMDADFTVCLSTLNDDTTDAGAGSVSVSAGGTVFYTRTLNMIGDVTAMSITQNHKHWAVGGALDGTSTFSAASLVMKDKAGNTITASDTLDDEVAITISDVATALVKLGEEGNFSGATGTDGRVSLGDICAGKVSGDKVKVDFTYENYDEDDVTTSATWTCTDATGKITNLALASGAVNPAETVKLNVTVVDSAGLACGYGCTIRDSSTVTRTPVGTDGTNTLRDAAGDSNLAAADITGTLFGATLVDGTASVLVTAPTTNGSYAAVIAYTDVDSGTATTAGSWTIRLAVKNIAAAPTATELTAGPKGLKATANFGAGAADAKIAFTLERSNGTVKTYYRKANASGVATFTLRFKGTYEVTAAFGDYITDSVTLKK
jgi:hypothetical protein